MAASSVLDLYKFEDVVENAATASLNSNGITASIQRQDIVNTAPVVEVQCVMGSARNHFTMVSGLPENDTWDGQLVCMIKTNRSRNHSSHTGLVANVRRLFRNNDALNSGSLMPYHQILDFNELGTSPPIQAGDNLDISAISFGFVLSIRPDAWP